MFQLLFDRQSGLCAICEKSLPEERHLIHIDHIKRKTDGGTWTEENLRLIDVACDWEREGNAPRSPYPEMATLFRTYKFWQRERQRATNMLLAYQGDKEGTTKSPYSDVDSLVYLHDLAEAAAAREAGLAKQIKTAVQQIPMGEITLAAPGGGPIVAAMLLSRVDMTIADSVSSVWKFFGLAGSIKARHEDGVAGGGRQEDRAILFNLEKNLIRKTSPYRPDYDKRRAITESGDRGWTKGHAQNDAMRYVGKLWLSHWWLRYRDILGLERRIPYATGVLQHDGMIEPERRGW